MKYISFIFNPRSFFLFIKLYTKILSVKWLGYDLIISKKLWFGLVK